MSLFHDLLSCKAKQTECQVQNSQKSPVEIFNNLYNIYIDIELFHKISVTLLDIKWEHEE